MSILQRANERLCSLNQGKLREVLIKMFSHQAFSWPHLQATTTTEVATEDSE
jgi:hypothetical protein